MWKIEYEEKINSSIESLWELISLPSNLELFHPFCRSNKAIKWSGENSIDELIYLNGLKYIRKFTKWEKKKEKEKEKERKERKERKEKKR